MSNTKLTNAFCASAMALTLAFSTAAFAQGMKMDAMSSGQTVGHGTRKVIAENEKLQVLDVVYQPGEGAAMASRLGMVIHFLTDATFERDFADGSKKTFTRKAGQTELINEKRQYSTKNVGKTPIHLIGIALK